MSAPSASQQRDFEAWLEARVPRADWGRLNLEDLSLSFRALAGVPAALAEVERRLKRVTRAVAGRDGDEDFVQEVTQRVRQRLLVGSKPRLASYQGAGALVVYLKAVALSVSVDLRRASKSREAPSGDERLLSLAAEQEGLDAQLAHADHRAHFTAAFKEALAALSGEERTWLRMRFVEGLSVDEVGATFGVHRTTAMRWLEKVQRRLLSETRKRMSARLGLSVRSLDSLFVAMRPSLAENLSRLLRRPSRATSR